MSTLQITSYCEQHWRGGGRRFSVTGDQMSDVTWRDDAALESHIETIHTKAELLELEQSQFVHKNKNVITLGIKSN